MLRCQFLCYVLKTIFFVKIALKLNYFCKKMQSFRALGAQPPDPPLASGSRGPRPQTPKLSSPLHCEFLDTRPPENSIIFHFVVQIPILLYLKKQKIFAFFLSTKNPAVLDLYTHHSYDNTSYLGCQWETIPSCSVLEYRYDWCQIGYRLWTWNLSFSWPLLVAEYKL